ncbi:kinase-like domain-containing protein [Umbelopsis sp. AD052]|nr:kinase-like domain-containing protein [Umbelopsis sp. AD052]
MSSAFNKYSPAPGAGHYQQDYRQRIPQQQGVGQTLPSMPVGSEPHNTPPPPPGAMSPGTQVVVGRHTVAIQIFLAEGGFAHVYLVRMKEFPDPIVLKRIAVPDTERLKSVEKEIVFMRRLGSHKNIVRYFDSQVSPLPTGGFEALILMEYCPGGGVIDLMNRRLQQRLTEPEILKIFGDVSEALAYMHYCNPPALHRDLKVENILISASGRYKLCDFGSACLSKGTYVPQTLPEIQKLEDDIQRHTTLQYRAPEMIDIYQKRPINEKADIWALGVFLYKLCYYTTPFEEQGPLAILSAKFTFPPRPQFSDNTRNLISWLLSEDQDRRPNIYQVVETVCKLRGKDCPIRNIYTNVSSTSSPQSQTSDVSKRGSESIFEQRVLPKQETPNITPMRRGRPERKEKDTPERMSTDDSKSSENFDPFDPKSFSSSTNHKQSAPDFDPAKIFSLNENTSFTSKADSSDTDSRKSPSVSRVLNTIPTQSSAPQPSTPGLNPSQENSSKTGRYQRAASPSTPDSFKSPKSETQTQQLIDDNELLKSSRSGGQLHTPRQSSLGNRAVSPVRSGSDNTRDTKSAPGTPISTAAAAKSPLSSHTLASREELESTSKQYGPSTSKPRYGNLQKAEQMSDGLGLGHSRNNSDSRSSAAQELELSGW